MHADMKISTGSVSLGMEEVTCRSGNQKPRNWANQLRDWLDAVQTQTKQLSVFLSQGGKLPACQ